MFSLMKDPLFDVSKSTVIVTGGLGQLGREFTKVLLERGAKVAVFDIVKPSKSLKALFGPKATGKNLLCLKVDITDSASLKAGLAVVEGR